MSDFNNYHKLRGNDIQNIEEHIPRFVFDSVPASKEASILDIGCGNGSFLFALQKAGYNNVFGIDLDSEALSIAKSNGVPCEMQDALQYCPQKQYDFVYISHVLEHLPKEDVINFCTHIYNNILKEQGKLLVRVPNAQSGIGSYWAYEDFTHNFLFTAGSLDYVLKAAGFNEVTFIDIDGTADSRWYGKAIKKPLVALYRFHRWFWNQATGSVYHPKSKNIYTWEIKAVACKNNNK